MECRTCRYLEEMDGKPFCAKPAIIEEHTAACVNVSTGTRAISIPHAHIMHGFWCGIRIDLKYKRDWDCAVCGEELVYDPEEATLTCICGSVRGYRPLLKPDIWIPIIPEITEVML